MKNLILLHANGYLPNCYDKILSGLESEYKIHKFIAYPFIEDGRVRSYDFFVKKLYQYIKENNLENSSIVAHSFGTVLALKTLNLEADLFQKMVLIEPVLVSHFKLTAVSLMPYWMRKIFIKEINQAFKRTDSWPSFDLAFKYFRGKKYFKYFSNDALKSYLNDILIKDENSVKLAFSTESEAHGYSQVKSPWIELKNCKVPYLGLRGEHSNIIDDQSYEKWLQSSGANSIINVPNFAHLLPFEAPEIVNRYIKEYLLDK